MGDPGAASRRKNRLPKGGSESSDLHAAARNGDLTTVESICNANPLAVNSRDRHSRTPLHLVAWSEQIEVVRFLCKNKADVGADAIKGHVENIRNLLSSDVSVKAGLHGASLTATTKAWQTPIDLVSTEEVLALLVEGKQPMTKDDKSTTIKEVGDSVSTDDIEENNGGSIPKECANIDKEGTDTKKKRRGEDAADEDSSKPKKSLKVSLVHLTAENDVLDEDEEKDADTKVNNHIRAALVLKL